MMESGQAVENMAKWSRNQKITVWGFVVSAFVALTVAAVVHFDSKAKTPTSTGNATTEGSQSPAITGDQNSVTYDKDSTPKAKKQK